MLYLPKDSESQVAVLNQILNASEQAAIPRKVQWMINHFWLKGNRRLVVDYSTGYVDAIYANSKDETGQLQVKYEKIVAKHRAEMGRLGRMDIRPSAVRRGYGLDGVRKASTARILLDYLTSSVNLDLLKLSVNYHCTMFGMCGIGAWAKAAKTPSMPPQDGTSVPATDKGPQESRLMMEVIPAWQLFSLPHNPMSPEEVDGICRARWVPLEWLKSRSGISLPRGDNEGKLQIQRAAYGAKPMQDSPIATAYGLPDARDQRSAGKTAKQPKNTDTDYVRLEEYFIFQEDKDRLARWVVKIGRHIAADVSFSDRSVYCPIGLCRYDLVGGFYGRSFVETLIPINCAAERMAENLFQNVIDLDAFGTTLLPQTWGVNKDALLDATKKRKVEFYEPDLSSPEARMQQVQPVNLNDFPGKVMAMADRMLDDLTAQSDMLSGAAPGRVDSRTGLDKIDEMSSIPLSVPAKSIAGGYIQVYNEILASAPEVIGNRGDIPLIGLDDSIIGLHIDQGGETIKIDAANFPSPFEVEIGIRDELPAPDSVREQKLIGSLQMGIITPTEFRMTVWKENLNIPVANWAEQENYRKSILQVLLLFGDGETPGTIIGSTKADNPEIHLMVIDMFMAKPEFQFASERVRNQFEQLKAAYQGALGTYPKALPRPEDAAAMNEQMTAGTFPRSMAG